MADFSRANHHVEIFLGTVNALLSIRVAGKSVCILDENKGYAHFRPQDFKKALDMVITEKNYGIKHNEYMRNFRTLQFIICDADRLTNTQRINGRTMRVITVDMEKFDLHMSWISGNSEQKR